MGVCFPFSLKEQGRKWCLNLCLVCLESFGGSGTTVQALCAANTALGDLLQVTPVEMPGDTGVLVVVSAGEEAR
jgi:hypothetical protein